MKLNARSSKGRSTADRPRRAARSRAAAETPRGFRARRRAATAEAFVDAAEIVFAAKGYERATMQDIARAAGCAAGTLYLYVDGKEPLFHAVVERHVVASEAERAAALASTADPVAALRAAVASLVAYSERHGAFLRIFFEAAPGGRAHGPSSLRGRALEVYRAGRARDVATMRRAQRAGAVRRDLPADELVEFLHAVVYATFARWALASADATPDGDGATTPPAARRVDFLWALVAGGLGAAERPS